MLLVSQTLQRVYFQVDLLRSIKLYFVFSNRLELRELRDKKKGTNYHNRFICHGNREARQITTIATH